MACRSAEELCDYLNVKSYKVDTADNPPEHPGTTGKIFKHWTNLWVVMHIEMSPSFSFIGHCKKESDWLAADSKIEKLPLGEPFEIEMQETGYSKKFDHVLQITFKSYQVDLAFDSETKMKNWHKALDKISNHFHVDLVRCPKYSHLEGQYIMEAGPSCFKAWTFHPDMESQVKWEWQLKHIRRVHWHKNLHKLEVEPGRSSQTGEGHFYFTGVQASRLFSVMRQLMTRRSTTPTNSGNSSPFLSQTDQQRRSDEPSLTQSVHTNPMYHRVEHRTDSEEDWTGGTGDSWTGTSDSGFFLGSSLPRPQDGRNHFILPSGPPPPLPARHKPSGHYADINIHMRDPDNEYVQITRQGHVYDIPEEENSATYKVPTRHAASSSSQDGISRLSITDDYCQMNSVTINRDIKRNGSLPLERPPPIPPHQKGVENPQNWANAPLSGQQTRL